MKTQTEALLDACAEFRAAARDWKNVSMFILDDDEPGIRGVVVSVELDGARDVARAVDWASDHSGWGMEEPEPQSVEVHGRNALVVSALGPGLAWAMRFRPGG